MLCLPVTSSYEGCPASYWRLTVSQDDRGRQDGRRRPDSLVLGRPSTDLPFYVLTKCCCYRLHLSLSFRRLTAQRCYVHVLTKLRFWYRVIARAFSHLWTKCEILILYRNEEKWLRKQFIKLEWMSKGIMSIPLFHKGFKPSRWLNSFMTCNVKYLLLVIRRKCLFCLQRRKISWFCQ